MLQERLGSGSSGQQQFEAMLRMKKIDGAIDGAAIKVAFRE